MKKSMLVLTLLLGSLFQVNAQTLKFKVANVKDTTVNLVKYVGSSLYYADTAEMKNGVVSFDGSKQSPGVMGLMVPGKGFFEFIYNNEDIQMSATAPDIRNTVKVKKSAENTVFTGYLNYLNEARKTSVDLTAELNALGEADSIKKEEITAKLIKVSEDVVDYQNKLIKDNPNLLASKIVKMSMDIEIPEAPKKQDGTPVDKLFGYKYLREHYFDNIDLTDDRLVNTPVIQTKVDKFLSKDFIMQNPDTIIRYITPVLDRIPQGSTMYRFFVTKVTAHFQKSKVMGMDKGLNTMVLSYYCNQDADGNYGAEWMETAKIEELCSETIKKMTTVLGNKPPNISLRDTTDTKWHNFYDIDAEYTILYFWDPECGHCKKETPKLGQLYREKLKERDVEVFAIGKATGDDFEGWKAFIKKHNLTFINVGLTQSLFEEASENPYAFVPQYTTAQSLNYQDAYNIYSTPQVFVLDKDKKIVGKQLSIAQLEDFIDRLQGEQDSEKVFDLEEEKRKMEEIEQKKKENENKSH